MASYFRACAKSTPELVTETPEALAIIHGDDGGVPADVEPVDHCSTEEESRTTQAHGGGGTGILEPITVAFKRPTTDPRNIDTVIGQTRALLDGPAAEALRRDARRKQALEARELEQAARDAARARAIEERTGRLLGEMRLSKSLAAAAASSSSSSVPMSPGADAASSAMHGASGIARSTVHDTTAAEDLPVPVVVDTSDAFSRLRVEEARRRLDESKRGAGGHSIIATYVAEDIELSSSAGEAAKAQALSNHPANASATQRVGSASTVRSTASSSGVVPLHQRIAARRREAAEGTSTAASKIGLLSINEDEAEERAAARAAERLRSLGDAKGSIASGIAAMRQHESAELEEQERRRKHQNDERRRALDESQAIRREAERHARIRARKQQGVSSASAADLLDDSAVESRATASILRSMPAGNGTSALVSNEAEEDARVLAKNLLRQERAEHPIDAYQRVVRQDMLRDRGYDDDSIAAIEAAAADVSLLQLAEAHDRSPPAPRRA